MPSTHLDPLSVQHVEENPRQESSGNAVMLHTDMLGTEAVHPILGMNRMVPSSVLLSGCRTLVKTWLKEGFVHVADDSCALFAARWTH